MVMLEEKCQEIKELATPESPGLNGSRSKMTSDDQKSPDYERTNSWTEAGSKYLGKKFGSTSRLMVSSKMWMHTIPTRDCDVLMTFPSKVQDGTLMWLLSRIRARVPDLLVHVRNHSNTGVYGFYLTANYDVLLRVAEELAIKKPIKAEFGGGMKEFVYEDQEYFENVEDSAQFLTSEERQSIVRHMLFNFRAVYGEELEKIKFMDGQAIVPYLMTKGIVKQVLPLHNNDDLSYLRQKWVQAFVRPQPLGKICEYFGVKIAMYFAYLGHYTRAVALPAFLGIILWFMEGSSQYMDDVCFVLFAFFNVIWATLYLESWKRTSSERAYQWGTHDKEDELLTEPRPLFHGYTSKSSITGRPEKKYPAWRRNLFRYFVSWPTIAVCLGVVFVTMWCIFELQDWINAKIKLGDLPFFLKFIPKILLALSIGVLDDIYKKIAYWLNDKENYRLEETYETNLIIKLILFQFVNSFLSLFYIAFYLRDMDRLKDQLATLLITRQVIGNIKEALIPYFVGKAKLVKLGYEMTEGLSPDTLEKQAKEISEGHPVKSDAQSNDTAHAQDLEEEKEDIFSEAFQIGAKLDERSGSIGECNDAKGGDREGAREAGELRRRGIHKELRKTPEGDMEVTHSGTSLTQAEVEASQKAYEDTFEDYLEMFIQFGYVTLFSSAFPLAALCALLNNVIEIRSDAFKLCMTFQRPFGQRVGNIGTWQDALEVMSVIAVMVNCALIGMSGLSDRLFPGVGTTERIIFIVILEHAVLAFKFMLAYAIPDVPNWVAEEKARLEFLRREALKRLESKSSSGGSTSQSQTPPTPGQALTDISGSSLSQRPAPPSVLAVVRKLPSPPATERGLRSPDAGSPSIKAEMLSHPAYRGSRHNLGHTDL